MKWLSAMYCDVMYAVYGCVNVNKCCVFNVIQWFLSVTLINPHNAIYCKLL